jgi:hypothetical protein
MSTTESFFQKVWDTVVSIFKHATPIEQSIAKFANAVTNKIKSLQSNETVQFLESGLITIAESIDPALTPMISGLELELPKILNVVTNVTGEISKPVNEQVDDAVTAITNIKGINSTIYAGILGAIAPAITNFVNTNNGIVVDPAQLIIAQQVVHTQA